LLPVAPDRRSVPRPTRALPASRPPARSPAVTMWWVIILIAPGRGSATIEAFEENSQLLAAADAFNSRGAVHCTNSSGPCCGDGVCSGSENAVNCLADCPGVTTDPSCFEEPHSSHGGNTLTWGMSNRAKSAQDCCDKCKAWTIKHPERKCDSWTFCRLPVCWGLDTGWNHTFGECWLRGYNAKKPEFMARGALTATFRVKHVNTRKTCKRDRSWHACPPTHVPWTSGKLGGPPVDRSVHWQMGGSWGHLVIGRVGEPLNEDGRQGKPARRRGKRKLRGI